MADVKKYSPEDPFVGMEVDPDGCHVLLEDYEAQEQRLGEMREFLKSIVDDFDRTPSVYSINRVLTKAEIQKMRRLVGE